jgi:hypothetical protein
LIKLVVLKPNQSTHLPTSPCIRILDDFPLGYLSYRIRSYLGRTAHACPLITEKIDWKPYLDRIFLAVLHLINPAIEIAGRGIPFVNSARSPTLYLDRYFGPDVIYTYDTPQLLISVLIIDEKLGEIVVKHIGKLVAVLLPLIGSADGELAGNFVIHLIHTVWNVVRDSSVRKPCSPEILAKFTAVVFPFVKSMIFSNSGRRALQVVPFIVGFNYELVLNDLFTFASNLRLNPIPWQLNSMQ